MFHFQFCYLSFCLYFQYLHCSIIHLVCHFYEGDFPLEYLYFLAPGPFLDPQPWSWPPIWIYRPWPSIFLYRSGTQSVFTGPGPQLVFSGPGPRFAFTYPGLQFVFTGPGFQVTFTGLGPRFLFTGPCPKFVFTGPSLQYYYLSGREFCIYRPCPLNLCLYLRPWPTICITGLGPEFAFTLLLVVAAVVVVIVVVVISLE